MRHSTHAHTYIYRGCQVYGKHGSPDSIVNADISRAPSDPKSDSVIKAWSSRITWAQLDLTSNQRPNVDSGGGAGYTVEPVPGGHIPPVADGVYGGGKGAKWSFASTYAIEGKVHNRSCTAKVQNSNCHIETIHTGTCYVNEGYGTGFGGGELVSYDGLTDNLGASYASQMENKQDNWSEAGIPFFGFADPGEDAALARIDHPLENIIPAAALLVGRSGVNYAGGRNNGAGRCLGTSSCLEFGDVLILIAHDYSHISGCSGRVAKLVLAQLETYGSPVSDTDNKSYATFRFSLDANGKDDWPPSVFKCLHGIAFNTLHWRLLSRKYF
jgi:hypothetical protein